MAAVSDHMGDQLGSIAYFDEHPADLCVLGELTGNQVCLGHRGRYYFDITTLGRSAHTCHKPPAINANVLAAQAVLALDASRYEPELEPWVVDLFGAETYIVPGRIYGGLRAGRAVDDPGRVRDPRGLPAAAGRRRSSRSAPRSTAASRARPAADPRFAPTSCSPT